jgi:hypothetical protein
VIALRKIVILRSARRARLEGRTVLIQADWDTIRNRPGTSGEIATPARKKEAGTIDIAGNFATFTFYYSRPPSRDPAFGIGVWECDPCGCLLQIRC